MGLFGIKKSGADLKTLSENEIQQRLYGHLRPPRTGLPARPAQAVKPLTVSEPKPAIKQAPVTSPSLAPNPAKPSEDTKDLFRFSAQPETEKKSLAAERPVRTERPSVPANPVPKIAANKKNTFKPVLDFISQKLLPFLGKALKAVFMPVFQLIAALIGWTVQFFLKIDYRDVRVRRTFYWTLGIGVFALMLVSIHVLNMKREFAMKHMPKVVYSKQTSKKKVKPVPPPVVTPAAETSASTSTGEAVSAAPGSEQTVSGSDSTPAAAVETPQKGYVIQIATFASQTDAQKLVDRLRQDQWACFAKPLVRPGGKTYYCVFLGAFKSYPEAEGKLADFKKKDISKPFQDAFIRTLS